MNRLSLCARIAPLVAPLFALGCSGGDAPSGGDDPLQGADAPLTIETALVASIGGFEAEGWQVMGSVGAVGFDGAGQLHILDSQGMKILVVTPSGELVRNFGRQGNGPGEFASPIGMAVFPSGEVVVSDPGNRGFHFFTAEGVFDRFLPFDGLNFAGQILPHPSGDLLAATGGGFRISFQGAGAAPPTTRPVQLFSRETAVPSILWEGWLMPPPEGSGGSTGSIMVGPGGSAIPQLPPLRAFEPGLHVGALPDGRLVVADSSSYRIRIVSGGVEEGVLERPIRPTPVTAAVQEAERARRLADMDEGRVTTRIVLQGPGGGGSGGGAPPMDMNALQRTRIESMVFAPEIPAIQRMAVDWEGVIWVERSGPRPGVQGSTDLITANGGYLGTLPPEGVRIPNAFGPDGLAAYLRDDDFGVTVVEIRRLLGRD